MNPVCFLIFYLFYIEKLKLNKSQQGEGVPATRKGSCANHVRDVKRFFKVHSNNILTLLII